ncbi:MAG: signal transduction protein [Caulobacter sp.]|nr:signal transduction protein [Caulobacter sp.]
MKAYMIAGVLLAMTAGAACAQPAPGKGGRGDANGDGKVTLAEFKAGRTAQMMRMDTDHDGKVSKAEFQAGMAARKARAPAAEGKGGDGSRMFGMLDGNGDGSLDKGELGKMAERRFGRMDADGDGVLTAAERQSAQGMMGGGR